MLRRRNIQLTLLALILVAAAVAVVFQREIRIAYHTSRLRASGRYLLLVNGSFTASPPKRLSFFEEQLIRLGHGNQVEESETMRRHTEALLKLGYFVAEDFPLRNRLYDGTNHGVFHHQMTNTFSYGTWEAVEGDYWDLSGTETNKIVVTTTRSLMPKWKKVVAEFDRPLEF